jgi:hypothetical protein
MQVAKFPGKVPNGSNLVPFRCQIGGKIKRADTEVCPLLFAGLPHKG